MLLRSLWGLSIYLFTYFLIFNIMFYLGYCCWGRMCRLEASAWYILSCEQRNRSKLGWHVSCVGSCIFQWIKSNLLVLLSECIYALSAESILISRLTLVNDFFLDRLTLRTVRFYSQIRLLIPRRIVKKWFVKQLWCFFLLYIL